MTGQEKEGELATTSLEFEYRYLHPKSRCEMLICVDDICSMFVYIRFCFVSASCSLVEI